MSGTAADITLAFGSGTAMTDTFFKFYGDVRGGLTHNFRTPVRSGTADFNLNWDISTTATATIIVLGYEDSS